MRRRTCAPKTVAAVVLLLCCGARVQANVHEAQAAGEQQILSYSDASEHMKALNRQRWWQRQCWGCVRSQQEWLVWREGAARPANIPAQPQIVYKGKGWRGWDHWLGLRAPHCQGGDSGQPAGGGVVPCEERRDSCVLRPTRAAAQPRGHLPPPCACMLATAATLRAAFRCFGVA